MIKSREEAGVDHASLEIIPLVEEVKEEFFPAVDMYVAWVGNERPTTLKGDGAKARA